MTILVPVDFSPCSRLAFQKAAELVQDGRGRIVALHVAWKSGGDKENPLPGSQEKT
ncbi:MAG: universal stress protein [Deltaproteobacteria bacterium]|nr:universal stress protein [Deltaproteobacteria bacterium]